MVYNVLSQLWAKFKLVDFFRHVGSVQVNEISNGESCQTLIFKHRYILWMGGKLLPPTIQVYMK